MLVPGDRKQLQKGTQFHPCRVMKVTEGRRKFATRRKLHVLFLSCGGTIAFHLGTFGFDAGGPDMEVQCMHNTYSELEGLNQDVCDTRFFRTVVLTGGIVMWLLIKFEKPAVLCPLWRIFTHQFTENITPEFLQFGTPMAELFRLSSPWSTSRKSADFCVTLWLKLSFTTLFRTMTEALHLVYLGRRPN